MVASILISFAAQHNNNELLYKWALQASKLLYRLSKDTANDTVFRREKLLEPLIRTVGRLPELLLPHHRVETV